MTRIAIVGASYATIAAALTLREELPAADITFINRTRTFVPRRFIPDILAARTTEHEHAIYLAALCEKHHIRFREDNLRGIETSERVLHLDSGERLAVEFLLIDLPHEPHSTDVPGAEYAHSLSGITSAHAIRKHLVEEAKQVRDTNHVKHRTTIVVGAGVSGIETVCAAQELSHELCEKNYLFPYELEHILIDGHAVPDPVPHVAKKHLMRVLEAGGIELYTKEPVQFTSESVVLGDRELQTDTIIWTATPKGNRLFKDLGLHTDERGFLVVDDKLQARHWIFAVGQSISASGAAILGNRSGNALIEEGFFAAKNIAASVHKKPLQSYVTRSDSTNVVALGKRFGFMWLGPLHWSGRIPVQWRIYREKRIGRTAQKI